MGCTTNPNPGGEPEVVVNGSPAEGEQKPGAPVEVSSDTPKRGTAQADDADLATGLVDFATFMRVDLRTGTVTAAEWVPKSDKLLKLQVDCGDLGTRTILAGIAQSYTVEAIVGQSVVAVVNLPPRKMMGQESHGMLLAAKSADGKVLLVQCPGVPNGSKLA